MTNKLTIEEAKSYLVEDLSNIVRADDQLIVTINLQFKDDIPSVYEVMVIDQELSLYKSYKDGFTDKFIQDYVNLYLELKTFKDKHGVIVCIEPQHYIMGQNKRNYSTIVKAANTED